MAKTRNRLQSAAALAILGVLFVAATVLCGLVAMHFVVMEVGIPLWISEHTTAPTSMVAVLLILNRQPNANIIDTVDRVKALLPQLAAQPATRFQAKLFNPNPEIES